MGWHDYSSAEYGPKSWGRYFNFNYNVTQGQIRLAHYLFRRGQAISLLLLLLGFLVYTVGTFMPSVLQYAPTTAIATVTKVREIHHKNHSQQHDFVDPRKLMYQKALSSNKFERAIRETQGLPHIKHFEFNINNQSMCNTNHEKGVYFLILVKSAPQNFQARQSIRNTWGSVKTLDNWAVRLIFMLGSDRRLETSIHDESLKYGDLVSSSSFEDTYRNLTLKHLMGYQWVTEYCPIAKFVVRSDDDIFIDIFQLFTFATSHHGFNPLNLLLCKPNYGMKPIRETDNYAQKWIVTKEEYDLDEYPPYCNGLGYLITPDVLGRLLSTSQRIPLFWIDDAYVTGILREAAGEEITVLNLGYSLHLSEYQNWLNIQVSGKSPFTFANVPRLPAFEATMGKMWNKTRVAWSK